MAWQSIAYSDYHAEFEGGREQGGRTLEPLPIDPTPRVAALVRDAPNVTAPVTYVELATGEIDREELAKRKERGTFTLGRALLAGLLEACLDAGVEVKTGTRVQALPDADAVVLATGGFERDPQLARAFLRGPMLAPVGAPLGPRRRPPARDCSGRPARLDERSLVVSRSPDPGGRHRRRADVPADPDRAGATGLPARERPGPAVRRRGAELQRPRPRPAELRADVVLVPERAGLARSSTASIARRIGSARSPAAIPIPTGSRGARRSAELAAEIGVPADELTATVSRFNEGARDGADPDFGRGSYPYDRFIGDLGPLEQAPYYAFKVLPGCLGTKGGPRTDADGRVLSITDGNPDPGPLRGGQRGGEPVRARVPRRRRDDRPGGRVRAQGRGCGSRGLTPHLRFTIGHPR